jgi:bacillithiol synthase
MVIHHLGFDKVKQFAKRDKDYQLKTENFTDFLSFSPDENGLLKAINDRGQYPVNRQELVNVIHRQYEKTDIKVKQKENLDALLDVHTFTVITAHQPALFTGPFYYITKIISTINLAENLTRKSGKRIVPIFINGSEDHDFEEINHLTIFGKKVLWQNEEQGPVGRKTLDGLLESFESFKSILGESEKADHIVNIIQQAFEKAETYNDFVFSLLNHLFGDKGLIVVNTDDAALKKLFVPVIRKELVERKSQSIVENSQSKLELMGYKSQAHAREINLFYIDKGMRERIVFEEGFYKVLNSELVWKENEILALAEANPEKFSPNVILRPVYQETLFPNLAYIGGGGELAYWQERKELMKYFNVFMPVLLRRNSTMFVLKPQLKVIEKLGLKWTDFFEDLNVINQNYLKTVSSIELDFNAEKQQAIDLFQSIIEKVTDIDKGLKDGVEVERTKMIKQVEQIEARVIKSLKKNEEIAINQIASVYNKLFPDGGLQERIDNFFQYYLFFGEDLLDMLYKELNPLNKDLVVIVDE